MENTDLKENYLRLMFLLVTCTVPTTFAWTFVPLASFELSHETEQTSGLDEVLRAKESYITEARKANYPVVLNLRDIFQDFLVAGVRPLIFFDNFRHVNMHPTDYPAILRTPVPTVQRKISWIV